MEEHLAPLVDSSANERAKCPGICSPKIPPTVKTIKVGKKSDEKCEFAGSSGESLAHFFGWMRTS